METILYNHKKHFETVICWLEFHNTYLPLAKEMPEIGFAAVTPEGQLAAFAFIRKVEGGHGQLDGLVSNPSLPPEIRSKAIDSVVKSILDEGKRLGMVCLIAYTKDKNTLMRSKKFGFVEVPQTLIAVKLS